MYTYKHNRNFFKDIDNERSAYWLGFLYADGCLYKEKHNKGYKFELSLKDSDLYHIETFANDIGCNVPIKRKIVKLNEKEYISNRLMFFCDIFADNLVDHGCFPNKSLTIKFPESNIVPEEHIHHFIRGFFDGDGYVWNGYKYDNKRKKKVFSPTFGFTSNENFCISLQETLFNACQMTKTKLCECGRAKSFSWTGINSMRRFCDYIYKDSTVFMNRKKETFDEIFALRSGNRMNVTDKNGESCNANTVLTI